MQRWRGTLAMRGRNVDLPDAQSGVTERRSAARNLSAAATAAGNEFPSSSSPGQPMSLNTWETNLTKSELGPLEARLLSASHMSANLQIRPLRKINGGRPPLDLPQDRQISKYVARTFSAG